MRHSRNHQPHVPSSPRLLHRQLSQQSRQLICINPQRTCISICNPPRHIRRTLAHFSIVAKHHPNQRLQLPRTPADRPGNSTSPRQAPRSLKHLPHRRHGAKYMRQPRANKKVPHPGGSSTRMQEAQASPSKQGHARQRQSAYFQPNRIRRVSIPAPRLNAPSSPTSGHSLPVLGNAFGAASAFGAGPAEAVSVG